MLISGIALVVVAAALDFFAVNIVDFINGLGAPLHGAHHGLLRDVGIGLATAVRTGGEHEPTDDQAGARASSHSEAASVVDFR